MSTILKALRRLEEERTAKAERALREQVVSATPRAPRNGRRLLLRTLGALAGLALLVSGVHHWLARPALAPASPPSAAVLPHPQGLPAGGAAANPLAQAPRPLGGPPGAPPLGSPPNPLSGGEAGPLQGAARATPPDVRAAAPPGAPRPDLPAGGPPLGTPASPLGSGEAGPIPGAARPAPADVRAAAAALAPRPDVAVVSRPPPPPASPTLPDEPPGAQARAPEPAPGTVPPFPRSAPSAAAPESSSDAEDASTSSVPIRLREVDPSLHSPYGIHEEAAPKKTSSAAKAGPASSTSQEVVVTRTIWHPSADRRVALVRGAGDAQEREVHEGDSVGSLQVLRIEPSDVVFLRDGVEIQKRVGAAR